MQRDWYCPSPGPSAKQTSSCTPLLLLSSTSRRAIFYQSDRCVVSRPKSHMSEFRQVQARKTTGALLRKRSAQPTQLNTEGSKGGSTHGIASTPTSTKRSTRSDIISQRVKLPWSGLVDLI